MQYGGISVVKNGSVTFFDVLNMNTVADGVLLLLPDALRNIRKNRKQSSPVVVPMNSFGQNITAKSIFFYLYANNGFTSMKFVVCILFLLLSSVYGCTDSKEQLAKSEKYRQSGSSKEFAGDRKGAIEDYSIAIKFDSKNADSYRRRGTNKLNLDLFQEAIEDFDQSLKLDTTDPRVYYCRGYCRHKLRNFSGAIEDFNREIALEPLDASGYFGRGNAEFALGEFQHALEDFDKAIYHKYFILGNAYVNRAKAEIMLGAKNEGCADLIQASQKGLDSATGIECDELIDKYCRKSNSIFDAE
jgi:tetratricopeptide (TPR) repeat protein